MFMLKKMDFEHYLKDDHFVRILIEDTEDTMESKNFIEKLISDNPGKKEEIRNAVQFIISNRHTSVELTKKEVADMWRNITVKTESRLHTVSQPEPKKSLKLSFVLKIAASVAILLAFGVYMYQKFSDDKFKNLAEKMVIAEDEAMIILSDGSKHVLTDNNSHIEYQSDGQEILINKPDNQTEKFINQKASEEKALNQIVVPYGRRHVLTLSDGTEVQLNSGSKLIFPAKFTEKTREVYLAGEGYFNVTKNSSKPFIVNTDFINIKVTGTQFNISAYQDEHIVSTVLVEGAVEVTEKNKLFNKPQFNLNPGQACFYSVSTSSAEVKNVNISQHISWINGWFQFKNQPLNDVLKKVEKYYKISVMVEGETLPNTIISGKLLLSEQYENVILYLARTLETDYEVMENGMYLIKEN